MKNLFVKMTALAAALVLACGLTACGGKGNGGDGERPGGDEPSGQQRYADSDIMPEYLVGNYALEAGDAAPDFTVELVDANGLTGETLSLADLAGKIVVVDFWATWCPYCVRDMPVWQDLLAKYGDDLVILAVDAGGDTFGEMKDFIAKKGYGFTFALGNEAIANAYPCPGIPYDVIIGRDGVIAFTAEGSYGKNMADVMTGVIDDLL